MNKILIIVPHQDDELNIVGPLIPDFYKLNYQIEVLYTTNGDYVLNNNRSKEAEKVAKLLKIHKITYLGYPDHGVKPSCGNIYNNYGDYESLHGRTYTEGPNGIREFCYQKHHKHNILNKNNYFFDLRDFIIDCSPNVIFVIGYEDHPDHKITTLLLDEALNSIVLENKIKSLPLVFKSFAYLGTWRGLDDYFESEEKTTQPILDGKNKTIEPYCWDKRISIKVNPKYYSPFYWNSIIYKAYKKYKTQNGMSYFFKCMNSDKCFWFKDLSNIAPKCIFNATSGNTKWLNDGKVIDTNDVVGGLENELTKTWSPNKKDLNPTINITLKAACKIDHIVIYCINITKKPVYVLINKEASYSIDNYTNVIKLQNQLFLKNIRLEFEINKYQTLNISEIEIYENADYKKRAQSFINSLPVYKQKSYSKPSLFIGKSVRRINYFFLFTIARKLRR